MNRRFTIDPVAMAADDKLLDAIGGRFAATVDRTGDDELVETFRAFVLVVDHAPLADAGIASAIAAALAHTEDDQHTSPAFRVARKRLLLVVAASSVGLLTLSGVNTARPGDVLWPVSVALDGPRAESLSAKQSVMSHVDAAQRYLNKGLYGLAADQVKQARELLHQVRLEDGRLMLASQIDSLTSAINSAQVIGGTAGSLSSQNQGSGTGPVGQDEQGVALPPAAVEQPDADSGQTAPYVAPKADDKIDVDKPTKITPGNTVQPVTPKGSDPLVINKGSNGVAPGSGGGKGKPGIDKPDKNKPGKGNGRPIDEIPEKPVNELPQVAKPTTKPRPGVGTPPRAGLPVIDPTEPPVAEPAEPPVIEPTEPPVGDPTDPPVIEPTDPPVVDPTDPPVMGPTVPAPTDPPEPTLPEPTDPSEPTEPPGSQPDVPTDPPTAGASESATPEDPAVVPTSTKKTSVSPGRTWRITPA